MAVGILGSLKTCTKLLNRFWINKIRTVTTTVNLAHNVYGKDPLADNIVILHGLLSSKSNWDSMAKRVALATHKNVVTVDLRNHGESPHEVSHTYPELASDVIRLMDKLAIREATLIGHCQGGRTAMVLALTKPNRVAKLIVVDISPVSSEGIQNDFYPKLMEAMINIHLDPKGGLVRARREAKNKLENHAVLDFNALAFGLMNVGRRYDRKIGWKCNVNVLRNFFPAISKFPMDMVGRTYDGPTLFIAGERSNYIPLGDYDGIRSFFPDVQLKFVPKAGHYVHSDDPDAFFKLITKFITETETTNLNT